MDETTNAQQPTGDQPTTPPEFTPAAQAPAPGPAAQDPAAQAPAAQAHPQPQAPASGAQPPGQAPAPAQAQIPGGQAQTEPPNPFARPDAPYSFSRPDAPDSLSQADTTGSFAYPPPSEPAYQRPENPAYQPPENPAYTQQFHQPGYQQNPPYGQPYGAAQYPPAHTRPQPKRGFAAGIAVGAIALALISGVVGSVATLTLSGGGSNSAAPVITRDVSPASSKSTAPGTVEAAAATIKPSVVTLQVAGTEGGRAAQGTGSGVVIRDDGHILTNNHVVAPAASGGTVRVFFSDGSSREAKIVGRDPSNDLAVVKVDVAKGLKAATFADSSGLKIGQPVVAVGAPLGLSGTVTQGIVSAVDRPVRTGDGTGQDAVIDAVQTDAAINPGNSGGPLVDLNGRIVGINSAIATVGGGNNGFPGQSSQSGNIGVGFAIPADDAVRIAQQLIQDGKASHATLGVSAQDSTEGAGADVVSVVSGSAADKGKLRIGDIVTAVGDRRVVDVDSLVAAVRDHQPGDEVTITYQRSGKETKVEVTLGNS